MRTSVALRAATLIPLLALACGEPPVGGVDDGGSESGSDGSGDDAGSESGQSAEPLDPEDRDKIAVAGARRLSRHEYDRALADLLGDTTAPGSQLLPEDALTPFDNDIGKQVASLSYLESAEAIAREAAQRLVDDPARRDAVVGCVGDSASDAACMESFVASFGRRALRRPLSGEALDDFVALGLDVAQEAGDFDAGVAAVVSAMLLDTAFLYRIEHGTPVEGSPGVFRLDGYEVATRLSFFVLGTTPDDALLDAAANGEFDTVDGVRERAEALLASSPDARVQVDRFHALWLGYHRMPIDPALATKMRRESRLLLESVIFDQPSSWLDVFTAAGTFVDDTLAQHYGLPSPGSAVPRWVEYGDDGRAGLLSHGTFLSVGGFTGETSPTKRGALVRTRLMCETIAPPPPDVDADAPPPPDPNVCKAERYVEHRENPTCAACHDQMDPIGFGLENFDHSGQFRLTDPTAPSCVIAGDGEVSGLGSFNGPGELAGLLVDNGIIDACAVAQLYRYAMGRQEDDAGVALINALADDFAADDHRLDRLIVALVSHPAFMHRAEED